MVRVYSAGDNVLNLLLDRPKKIGEYMFIKIKNVKIAKLHWFTLITGPQACCELFTPYACGKMSTWSLEESQCLITSPPPFFALPITTHKVNLYSGLGFQHNHYSSTPVDYTHTIIK